MTEMSEQVQRCDSEHLSNFPRDLRDSRRSGRHAHYLAEPTNPCNTSRRVRRSRGIRCGLIVQPVA